MNVTLSVDVMSLIKDFLLKEYTAEMVDEMLSKATKSIDGNRILVVYENRVSEVFEICIKPVSLTQP